MRYIEIAFVSLSVWIIFFWNPPFPSFFFSKFLRFKPLRAYINFFALGGSWSMFSNPTSLYGEIKVIVAFEDREKLTGFWHEDSTLIEVIGVKDVVLIVKYLDAVGCERVAPVNLAQRIFVGFQNNGYKPRSVILASTAIDSKNFPHYSETHDKNLIKLTAAESKQILLTQKQNKG